MIIRKLLDISTAHIKPTTAVLLNNMAAPSGYAWNKDPGGIIVYDKGEYGWFVYLDFDGIDDEIEHHGNERIPQDLLDCIKLARDNDCDMLCLDGDSEVLTGVLSDYSEEW